MDNHSAVKSLISRVLAVLVLGLMVQSFASFGAIPQRERDALLALYESTGGPSWVNSTNWGGPAGSENTWYGVVTAPENTTVIGLSLKGNNLSGMLPPELGDLANLEDVDFSQNQLEGTPVTVEEITLSTFPAGSSESASAGQAADDQPVINGVEFKLHVKDGVVLVCKLTLTGQNFQAGCTVKINGQPAPKTLFKSASEVLAKGARS